MLKHLGVRDSGPLAPSSLLHLGRVNVLSGRNNSGKSTLLEAIRDPDRASPGLDAADFDVNAIGQSILAHTGWGGGAYHAENGFVRQFVGEVLTTRKIWFDGDVGDFANGFQQLFKSNHMLQRWDLRIGGVADVFRAQFPKMPKSVLIPAKRVLELTKEIALGDKIEPSGTGLLNFLFYAHNRPEADAARQLHSQIANAFARISGGYRFQVFPTRENRLQLNFAMPDRSWVAAGACGLGLQDLLVILYFALSDELALLLIEEPESHLHPDMQRRLLAFMRETAKQYLVATHSNVFLNNAFVDRVFFTTFSDKIHVTDETSRASILDDLGYSVADNLVSDLVILVEGPSDAPVLEELLKQRKLYGRFDIKIWPLGGDIMDQVDLSIFAQHYKIIALIDKDPGSARVRRRFEQKCNDASIPVHKLKRYALENYLTLPAIRTVFGAQVPAEVQKLAPDVAVEKQIGINVKRSNRKIVREMTLADIEGTDLSGFLDRVREILGA